jgi:serine phosphatase RsbU (regulator of sigma subunit)
VTCCAAQFLPGGDVLLANAGHCYPLCEGRELELLPALPLGVMPEAAWQETRISLGGASLTFVPDGMIEAVNANGELFGFQRTAAISTRTAEEIAESAKAWGQNDGITVVTVRAGQ